MNDKYDQLRGQLSDLNQSFIIGNWTVVQEISHLPYHLINILVRTALATNKPIWQVLTDLIQENVPKSDLTSPYAFRTFIHDMNEHLTNSPQHKFSVELQHLFFEYPPHILQCIVELSLLSFGERSKDNRVGQVMSHNFGSFDDGLTIVLGPDLVLEIFMITGIKNRPIPSDKVIGQLIVQPLLLPKSDLAKQFHPLSLLLAKQSKKFGLEHYEYTLGLLSYLSDHFKYGTINTHKVNKTVASIFSSVIASAFINAEIRQDKMIHMQPVYEPYLVEYLKYLSNEPNSLLDPLKFNDNFTFAISIGDNTLAFRQLNVLFPALETIQLNEADAVYNRIRVFLLSL